MWYAESKWKMAMPQQPRQSDRYSRWMSGVALCDATLLCLEVWSSIIIKGKYEKAESRRVLGLARLILGGPL